MDSLSKSPFPVPAPVKQAKDRCGRFVHRERNRDPALETDNAETGSNIVAKLTAFCSEVEAEAVSFQAVDIGIGDGFAGRLGNPLVKLR